MQLSDLPTRGILYGDLNWSIAPLGFDQLLSLATSATNDDHQLFAEVIASTTPLSSKELALSDMVAIAAYLRFRTFPLREVKLEWMCPGIYATKDGSPVDVNALSGTEEVEVEPCRCANSQTYSFKDLAMTQIKDFEQESWFKVPTADLYGEYVRMITERPELVKILPAVSWCAHGTTMAEKLDYIQKQEDLELFDKLSSVARKYKHGISRSLVAKCSKCGMPVTQQFHVTQHSFVQ